jgi:hypothetical protein
VCEAAVLSREWRKQTGVIDECSEHEPLFTRTEEAQGEKEGRVSRERAIVMGGGMGGLAAARVLSDHYGDFFPGLIQEAVNSGAPLIDRIREAHWCFQKGEHARPESGLISLLLSRLLLEPTSDSRRVTGTRTSAGILPADLVIDATGRVALAGLVGDDGLSPAGGRKNRN